MSEKIIRIEEVFGYMRNSEDHQSFDGYSVITDKQTIFVGVSNRQSCCEEWGSFVSEDSVSDFQGAELLGVTVVDKCLNSKKLEGILTLKVGPIGYEGTAMFINFETNVGTFQLTVYNRHNGYYGHNAIVISKQLNHEETI